MMIGFVQGIQIYTILVVRWFAVVACFGRMGCYAGMIWWLCVVVWCDILLNVTLHCEKDCIKVSICQEQRDQEDANLYKMYVEAARYEFCRNCENY
jgi:hypothetical protein